MNDVPQKMECAELLSHVQSAESALPISSDAYFGHPPPPQIHIIQVPPPMNNSGSSSGNVVHLGAAVTKRCVSAQLWRNGIAKSEPIDVLCLSTPEAETDDEEEEITCATLLTLDPSIKGSDDSTVCASIVVGTNFNRVLSLEVVVMEEGRDTLSLHQGLPPFEPLPLDAPQRKQGAVDDVSDHTSVHSIMSDTSKHGKRGVNDSFRSSHHGTATKKDSCVSCTGPALGKASSSNRKPMTDGLPHNFCPRGGVTSVLPFRVCLKEDDELTTVVWIAYGDGTIVRVHHGSLFSFVVHHDDFRSVLAKAVLRSRVLLPPPSVEDSSVLPLPKYHPSPLAPLPAWKPPLHEDSLGSPAGTTAASDDDDEEEVSPFEDDEMEENLPEFHEAVAYGGEQFPALVFYTSEDQFVGRVAGDDLNGRRNSQDQDAALLGHVIGGTTALVSGVVGTALGVVKWGLGQGDKETEVNSETPVTEDGVMLDHEEERGESDTTFVSPMIHALHSEPNYLLAGCEIHDTPRHVTSVIVDSDGDLAAATDTLGRVLLLELSTKQVIRMFKGVRDASCAWIEIPRSNVTNTWQKKKVLYLAIHSRHRRTVDIYRTRHGPRVYTKQVGRDAQLIQSVSFRENRPFACCYILHSTAPGTTLNQLESLAVKGEVVAGRSEITADQCVAVRGRHSSAHEGTMRLQILQQLLAKTNVPTERQDVFEALTQITSLKDLCTALDVLAVAGQLEDSMGVIGTEFHSSAVAHCKQTLENVIREGGHDAVENAQVKELASRIGYHTQLIDAYDVLHEFETNDIVDDERDERVAPRSAWAVEAMAWLTMHETVTGSSVDASVIEQSRPVLQFWAFATDCSDYSQLVSVASKGSSSVSRNIRFTDSTKSRKEVLVHIFKPLLRDIFSFNVVGSIFDALGVSDDTDYLSKCFGDWFVSIRAREAARKGLFGLHSPMVRWLQDTVARELDAIVAPTDENSEILLLGSLHDFCMKASDLVRAFFLATLCREAVSIATKKREAKTYGKVSSAKSVKPWNDLLRKLRVCLLVSLRLNGMDLGAFPITVSNVEADDIFSAYEWLARDELMMSHTQEEIVSLENACQGSGLVFDPSSEAGDNPNRWKMLQQACLAAAISEEEREEFLLDMDDDDQLGALLLYLSQFNNPALLVAHRALLLARQWVHKPSDLQPLNDCLAALRGLRDDEEYRPLCYAVRAEVWQSAMRPFYRAVFFGFDDVHELDEGVAGPLLDNRDWVRGIGKVALPLLDMLEEVATWDDTMNAYAIQPPTDNTSWPPVKEDFILKRMVQSSRPVCLHALKAHRVVVCGTLVSEDMGALSDAVPELFDCFLPTSLFQSSGADMENTDKQMEFLEQAVIGRANEVEEAVPGRLDIGDIETLARLWDVNVKDIRTLYLLAIYELGKDSLVDEYVAASTAADLDVERFVSDGLGIACRRLNRILNVKRSPKTKAVMGVLDADTCEWLREQAEDSMSLLEGDDDDSRISIANTHLLILRLLGLGSSVDDKTMATKIHALSILSGTLLKAHEQE